MKKNSIVMLPFHDYKKWINEGFRTRDAHLFEHFNQREEIEKILVINRPVSIAEMIAKKKSWKTKIGEVVLKGKKWQLLKVNEKVYCIDIFVPDFFKVAIQRKTWWNTIFNKKEIIEIINNAINYLELNNITLLLQNPMAVGVIGKINEDKVVFDAIDNWICHPQMKKSKDIIVKNYEYIDKKADVIFTVSKNLMGLFKNNKNVFWIPNAVDKEFFSKSISENKSNTICVGYVGKIQDRFDFKLLEKCLIRYPELEFLIIGPLYSQKKMKKYLKNKYTNVIFYGDIHYNKLPEVMKKIDIAIIPHKVDEFTCSMNPLKVYEYIAAGKQVVSTKVAGTDNISEFVYLADNDEIFIDEIQKAIDKYKEKENLGKNISKTLKDEFTWKKRVDDMIDKINNI